MNIPEKYRDRPNLWRLAVELSKLDNPERTVNALFSAISAYAGTEPPAPLPEGRSNNERFNAVLNNCQRARAVYDALSAFAEAGKGAPS